MKITAKVFMWISIIGYAIGAIVMVIVGALFLAGTLIPQDANITAQAMGITMIVLAFVFVLPIIFGLFGLKKLANATCKKDLIAPGVLVLIFCNIISLFIYPS